MPTIRELAEQARSREVAAFAAELGPFALMQRPDVVPTAGAVVRTAQLPTNRAAQRPVPVDFQDLLVARLPAPPPDGTVSLIVGRDAECDLVVDDAAVSKRHATIRWDGKAGVLQELGSTNGTFLNGARIQGPVVLKSNDQLSFGRSSFIYLTAADLHARLLRLR